MNKDRKVVMLRRDPDGIYERVDPIPSEPRPCESSESKRLRELATYGNTACRVKDGGCWAELRCVPAGTYTVAGEWIAIPETNIVVTKNEAFLFEPPAWVMKKYAASKNLCQAQRPAAIIQKSCQI